VLPIRTERLVIRKMEHGDVASYVEYASDWDNTLQWLGSQIPPTAEKVHADVEQEAGDEWPGEGSSWRLAVELDGELIGNLFTDIRSGGGIAEVGYVLRPAFRGAGYAGEATGALVDELIAHHGIHRIEASLSPRNVASMRVLESIGMTFEVLARDAYNLDGVWEDDLRYAMTAVDRAAWVERDRSRVTEIELVEITPDDAYLWGRLRTHHSQESLVAPMPVTWRDALFPEVVEGVQMVPWMGGVLAGGERVGFVMLSTTYDLRPGWYLWRLLIDRMHQRRGIGELVVKAVAALADEQLYTSCVDGVPGSPRPFYERLGFTPTGRIVDDELELVLKV
jgi:RimJ/RimL family protein N-acetyltransferase